MKTVVIKADNPNRSGKGSVITGGRVLTALHVIRGARRISVNGRRATILEKIEAKDLAWLEVNTQGWEESELGNHDRKVGATYKGLPVTVGVADISTYEGRYLTLHKLDRKVSSGDSGSPVIQDGKVIGTVLVRGQDGYGRIVLLRGLI